MIDDKIKKGALIRKLFLFHICNVNEFSHIEGRKKLWKKKN